MWVDALYLDIHGFIELCQNNNLDQQIKVIEIVYTEYVENECVSTTEQILAIILMVKDTRFLRDVVLEKTMNGINSLDCWK